MANEQELLRNGIKDTLREAMDRDCTPGETYINLRADQILAKLKAMGYVKWDREKVAMEICSLKGSSWCKQGCIGCGWLQPNYKTTDQLKEILTGGE